MSWEAISAISSVITTTLLVAAAWIALRQVKESLSTRQLQAILGFIEQLQSTSLRSTRRLLKSHRAELAKILAEPDSQDKLDAFLRRKGKDTGGAASLPQLRRDLASLEFIAVLSLHGKIPLELERAYLAPTIIGYWEDVEPIVQATRAEVGPAMPLFLQHFECLVRLATAGDLYSRRVDRIKRREVKRLIEQSRIATSGISPPNLDNVDADEVGPALDPDATGARTAAGGGRPQGRP